MLGEIISFSLLSFSAIFFIVDPLVVVPMFITMTEGDSAEKKRSMARKACYITAGVLTFFALGGGVLFKVLGVTIAAFQIAGGILLLLASLDQLRSEPAKIRTSAEELAEAVAKPDIAIVPLAMPLLAGPGSIATVMVLTARTQHFWEFIPIIGSIWLTSLIAYYLLRGAGLVNRVLGKGGRAILERIMGLLLAAIAVQFMVGGVTQAFPSVFGSAERPPVIESSSSK